MKAPEHEAARVHHRPGLAEEVSAHPHSDQKTRPEGHHHMSSYGPQHPAVAPAVSRLDDRPSSRAFALPPVAGRSLWAVPVLHCSWCGGGHVHRTADVEMLLAGKLLRRCPVVGRLYRLGPVQRRNEARRHVRLVRAA